MNDESLTLTSYAALFLSVYFTDLSKNTTLKRFICHILYFIFKKSTSKHPESHLR